MNYKDEGVECAGGLPVCHLDDDLCQVDVCRYWISYIEFGNCACRVDRRMSLEEVGVAIGCSKEGVRKIEARAVAKIKKMAEFEKLVREAAEAREGD